MALNLGKGYSERFGQNISQMRLLLEAGEAPASVSKIYHKRLDRTDKEVRENWLNNYFDGSDLMAYDNAKRSQKVKIVFTVDSQGRLTEAGKSALGLINPEAPMVSRAVKLSNEQYDTLPGIELTINDFGVINEPLTKRQVLDSRLHRILARNPDEVPAGFSEDKNLLPAYVSTIFRLGKSRHDYDAMMGIYPDSHQKNSAQLRAWLVYLLGLGSSVDGGNYLGSDYGRFVGIAPEAQIAQNLSLPKQNVQVQRKIISPTLAQILALGRGRVPKDCWQSYKSGARKLFGK